MNYDFSGVHQYEQTRRHPSLVLTQVGERLSVVILSASIQGFRYHCTEGAELFLFSSQSRLNRWGWRVHDKTRKKRYEVCINR